MVRQTIERDVRSCHYNDTLSWSNDYSSPAQTIVALLSLFFKICRHGSQTALRVVCQHSCRGNVATVDYRLTKCVS